MRSLSLGEDIERRKRALRMGPCKTKGRASENTSISFHCWDHQPTFKPRLEDEGLPEEKRQREILISFLIFSWERTSCWSRFRHRSKFSFSRIFLNSGQSCWNSRGSRLSKCEWPSILNICSKDQGCPSLRLSALKRESWWLIVNSAENL